MFRKKAKKNIGNMDKVITGVIIGSAVASIFGLSKIKKGQEPKDVPEKKGGVFALIGRILVGVLRLFSKKK